MDLILTALASPLLSGSIALSVALGLLISLGALCIYGGIYYALPRFVLKWLSRRALAA